MGRAANATMEEKASLCESLCAESLVLLHRAAEMNGKLKSENMILKSIATSLRKHQANDYPQPKQMHNAHGLIGLIQGQSLGEPHRQTQQQHQQRHCRQRWQTHQQQQRNGCRLQTYQQDQEHRVSREALQNPPVPCTSNKQAMIRQLQFLQMPPELHAWSDLQTLPSDSTAVFSMASTAASVSASASTGGSESVAATDDVEWEELD